MFEKSGALALIVILFLGPLPAWARHVSFLGGTSVMSWNRPDWNELMVSSTFWPAFAPGLTYRVYREGPAKHHFVIPTLHMLPMRLNEEFSQANLYASVGAGVDQAEGRNGTALLGALEGDWETRSLGASLRYENLGTERAQPYELTRGRFGFAPYLAEFEGLHTWVYIQFESESRTAATEWTPVLRWTYLNTMLEFGASFTGAWQFNWAMEM